jgi:site-specific DNA-methyltransferase (adenine-specific)
LVASGKYKKFDYIFTNPPWGKKLLQKEKISLASHFNIKSPLDTSALFLFASMESLKKNGTLGLLFPEAFFNISAFFEARQYALKHTIKRVVDYGKVFPTLVTKAQGIVIAKRSAEQNAKAWKVL